MFEPGLAIYLLAEAWLLVREHDVFDMIDLLNPILLLLLLPVLITTVGEYLAWGMFWGV